MNDLVFIAMALLNSTVFKADDENKIIFFLKALKISLDCYISSTQGMNPVIFLANYDFISI